jgi:CheY-like chemotaxis protein
MSDSFRVLVVDDEADFAMTMGRALELDGYLVRIATDGRQALAAAQDFKPECVLLDIDMPDIGGVEVARQLRTLCGGHVVLIAVTGWGDSDLRISPLLADFDHYLRKPVNPAVLQTLLPPLV